MLWEEICIVLNGRVLLGCILELYCNMFKEVIFYYVEVLGKFDLMCIVLCGVIIFIKFMCV